MPGGGIEPPRCRQRGILSPVRLPIPPSRHEVQLQLQYYSKILAMKTQDFDFYLPDTLIAQHPTNKRNQSRLLHLDSTKNELKDQLFIDLPNFLNPGDLLVFNDTRVIKARLFGCKASGGMVEVLIERALNAHQAFAHVRASRAPKIGSQLILADVIK